MCDNEMPQTPPVLKSILFLASETVHTRLNTERTTADVKECKAADEKSANDLIQLDGEAAAKAQGPVEKPTVDEGEYLTILFSFSCSLWHLVAHFGI